MLRTTVAKNSVFPGPCDLPKDLFKGPPVSKYFNIKTVVDGITFGSIKEAARYGELKILEKAGMISNLVIHPRFMIVPTVTWINKKFHARYYYADFQYDQKNLVIVEDVKSPPTRKKALYTLKRQLFLSQYGDKYLFLET